MGLLFTAFEPSGDALAAAVVAELKAKHPDLAIAALGGEQVQAAGAELLESTTHHASMFFDTLKHAWSHRARLKRLRGWLHDHDVTALVPTDSPAANWSICKLVRREKPDAKIVHLVAPQLWAWAPWRIRKMRRLSDHALCLWPFEPAWFEQRGMPATFVGHPLFEQPRQIVTDEQGEAQRLALLPGSRDSEIRKNWPTMSEAFTLLKQRHPHLTGRVAALDDRIAAMIPRPLPDGVEIRVAETDDVLAWSQVVLVASGTASLQVAAHGRPMVVMYNVSRLGYWLLARWLVTIRTYAPPNLISEWQDGSRAVTEFMPLFGQAPPVVSALDELIRDGGVRQRQLEAITRVVEPFADQRFGEAASARLLEIVGPV